jgi:hypothetical protein
MGRKCWDWYLFLQLGDSGFSAGEEIDVIEIIIYKLY